MVSKFCETNNFTFCLVTNLIDESFSSLGPWHPYLQSLSADIGIQNISSRSRTCIQPQHILLWFHSSPYFRGQGRCRLGRTGAIRQWIAEERHQSQFDLSLTLFSFREKIWYHMSLTVGEFFPQRVLEAFDFENWQKIARSWPCVIFSMFMIR